MPRRHKTPDEERASSLREIENRAARDRWAAEARAKNATWTPEQREIMRAKGRRAPVSLPKLNLPEVE